MGQKVHPNGFRLGIIRDWKAKWYADKQYTEFLMEDLDIRRLIEKKYKDADISTVEIDRGSHQVSVTIYTAKPGIVIGRGGQRVDEMRALLEKETGKKINTILQQRYYAEMHARRKRGGLHSVTDLGELAVRYLSELIARLPDTRQRYERGNHTVLVPTELIIRGST